MYSHTKNAKYKKKIVYFGRPWDEKIGVFQDSLIYIVILEYLWPFGISISIWVSFSHFSISIWVSFSHFTFFVH
jgi:hypothetical protein